MLNLTVRGEGQCLVCLHGFLETKEIWSALKLENNFKIVAVDLPGHGASEFSSISDIAAIASLIPTTLQEIGIRDYWVIGHSLGGYIGLELIQLDQNCEQLFLLNSNFWSDNPEKQLARQRVAELVAEHKELFIKEAIPSLFFNANKHKNRIKLLIDAALQMEAEHIASYSLMMANRRDHSEWLKSNPEKISIIQGRLDSVVPEKMMTDNLCSMPTIDYHVVESGHMAWDESPDELVNLLSKKTGTLVPVIIKYPD